MADQNDPKALRQTIQRSQRHLTRQHQSVLQLVQQDPAADPAGLARQIRQIQTQSRILAKERDEFNALLSKYEQLTVDETDQDLLQERTEWGDLVHLALSSYTEAEMTLVELRQSQAPPPQLVPNPAGPVPPAGPAQADLSQNIERLVTLIAQREQQAVDRQAAGHDHPSPQAFSSSKLPKMELVKFKDDVLKWRPFWDQFHHSVDKNPKLAPVDKMNYLVSFLEGEALKAVKSLPLTDANYAVAVDLLKKRYGDTKLVITKLYRQLNESKVVKNDPKELRAFVAEIDCLMGSLSALGQNVGDDNFATIILSKLLEETVMALEIEKKIDTQWTVALVREKLTEYLIRLERVSLISAGRQKQPKTEKSGDSLHAGSEKKGKGGKPRKDKRGDDPKPKPRCVFCNTEDHYSDKCSKYADIDSRLQRLGKKCYNCLSPDHMAHACLRTKPCFYCKKTKHHSALCRQQFGGGNSKGGKDGSHMANDEDDNKAVEDSGTATGFLATDEEALLQTALIRVQDPRRNGKSTKVRVLLDPGSNRSYCSTTLAKAISLKLTEGPNLSVNRFGSKNPVSIPTQTAKLKLNQLDGSTKEIVVSVIDRITGNLARTPLVGDCLHRFSKSLTLADTLPENRKSGPIELLIGSDYYLDLIDGQKKEVSPGLYLLNSVFGWILTGRVKQSQDESHAMSMCGFAIGANERMSELFVLPQGDPISPKAPEMSDFWSLETLGITENPEQTADDIASEDFNKNVKFVDGRYQVSLPWSDRATELQTDYNLSIGRLRSLLKRLKDDKSLLTEYARILNDQHEKGVIEKVDENQKSPRVHYIPHHAVVRPDKETTKVRVVFDGSAKTRKNSPSLNECLFRGPVLLDDLAGILMRFRLHPVGITADIEKAFLQICIRPEDRDSTRFLWLKDLDNPVLEDNIQEFRLARVPFGLNCSPSLLAQTVHHHLLLDGTVTAQKILKDLYVDNVITGVKSSKEAAAFYKESKEIFQRASMNLRCWSSNSPEFKNSLPPEDRVASKTVKVLGLKWTLADDTLSVQGLAADKVQQVNTRRELLSAISSVFDPLGPLTPCNIGGKCLLQQLTKVKGSWDEPMPESFVTEWLKECETLKDIGAVPIPRLIPSNGRRILIAFSDASESAFATTVYLRVEEDGRCFSNLVFSRSRLNPPTKLTVPRLELMGNLIAKRSLLFVQGQLRLPIEEMYLFSDSQISLSWIKSPKDSDRFVKNRVREIQEIHNVTARYVKTDHNPADWATRGKKSKELDDFWWHGPKWLIKDPQDWPTWDFEPFLIKRCHETTKKNPEISFVVTEDVSPFGIDPNRYSSLTKLLRVTAYCQRFVRNLKGDKTTGHLQASDLSVAKRLWEVSIQKSHFSEILDSLKKGTKHDLSQLGIFLDHDGMLRVKGRMGKANLEWSQKFPKLMPKKAFYSTLLVHHMHALSGHGSVSPTLSRLRTEYWVPKGRSLVQQVIKKCNVCRKGTGKAYGTPPMPELPSSRVTPQACFTNTGVDYFGPVSVKVNEKTKKTWVALFTCLSTRAIHLEVVMDLSSFEFLLALKRFIARRGSPDAMLCDNAPQFKLVAKATELAWRKATTDPEVADYCANNGISWSFITEFAPFMGGVYERLIGVTKNCLRKTVGSALLTVKQFETLLCECEAIVNTRHLVYVGPDINPGGVITPSHFLTLNPKVLHNERTLKNDLYRLQGSTANDLIQEWKKGNRILNEFWKTWSSEYLSALRERSRYSHRHNSASPEKPKIGHVVLIKEQNLPRGSWKMARVSELHESQDRQIRSVTLTLPNGRQLRRPLHLLIPIEVSSESETQAQVDGKVMPESDDESSGRHSPEL